MHRSDVSIPILKLNQKGKPVVCGPFVHMERHIFPWILAWSPSIHDRDLASVTQLRSFAVNGHPSEGGPTHVEMRTAEGAVAAGALVRYDHRHRTP